MCGRFTLRSNLSLLATQLELPFTPDFAPHNNLAPMNDVLTVVAEGAGRTARTMRWGLVPSWADDLKIGSRMINARAETVAEKPSFRAAFKFRRCLIIADGYYEWTTEGKRKTPHIIHLADHQPFAFAGLWETWKKGDRPLETCTIITTAANSLTRPLHERMPVILDPADYHAWLAPPTPREELLALLRPYPPEAMQFEPVHDFPHQQTAKEPYAEDASPREVEIRGGSLAGGSAGP